MPAASSNHPPSLDNNAPDDPSVNRNLRPMSPCLREPKQKGRLAPPPGFFSSERLRYFALPILYMPVPHVGHTPFVAGLPFFMVTAVASFISRCVLHFRQYASTVIPPLATAIAGSLAGPRTRPASSEYTD
jgi:hypothetical protein